MSTRRRALAAELGILGVTVLLFGAVHSRVGLDVSVATANAERLQSLEQVLHVDVETTANRWLVGRQGLAVAASYLYRLYYVVLVAVLAWAWVRHPDTYVKARRALLAMAVIALLVYWAVPMSPPRFSLPGIVDVVSQHDILGDRARQAGGAGAYSAMPSLHVGLSAWCAYTVWTALRPTRPLLAGAAWLFPALMTATVIGTGNHFVLDVVGSALLLALAVRAAESRLVWR
jgi:membrane-associated phospholipid phosphatase